jgi:hypothetical protein
MTEQPKLFGMCEEQLNAYLKAMSQTQSKPQSSYQPETKKKPEEPPQYFYDISTNLFIISTNLFI